MAAFIASSSLALRQLLLLLHPSLPSAFEIFLASVEKVFAEELSTCDWLAFAFLIPSSCTLGTDLLHLWRHRRAYISDHAASSVAFSKTQSDDLNERRHLSPFRLVSPSNDLVRDRVNVLHCELLSRALTLRQQARANRGSMFWAF